jgi:hypothetical protein
LRYENYLCARVELPQRVKREIIRQKNGHNYFNQQDVIQRAFALSILFQEQYKNHRIIFITHYYERKKEEEKNSLFTHYI